MLAVEQIENHLLGLSQSNILNLWVRAEMRANHVSLFDFVRPYRCSLL